MISWRITTQQQCPTKSMYIQTMALWIDADGKLRRFYNLQQWERRQEAIRMGEKPIPTGDSFDFKNDEEKLR